MTPHDFCCWLTGYLAAEPLGVSANVRKEFEKVDLTVLPWYVPVAPSDPPQSPSSPPAFSPRDPDGWEVPWYWDALTSSWLKLPRADVQYYRDLARSPSPH